MLFCEIKIGLKGKDVGCIQRALKIEADDRYLGVETKEL